MEILYSQLIGKALSILKQESNAFWHFGEDHIRCIFPQKIRLALETQRDETKAQEKRAEKGHLGACLTIGLAKKLRLGFSVI